MRGDFLKSPRICNVSGGDFLKSPRICNVSGGERHPSNPCLPLFTRRVQRGRCRSRKTRRRGFTLFLPSPVSSRPSVGYSVIPTERSERRDPQERMRSPLGISHFVLPIGKEIFRFRLPKRLSDKISEMTIGSGKK